MYLSICVLYFRTIARVAMLENAAVSPKDGEKGPREGGETCADS